MFYYNSQLLQFFGRMLQHYFTVKLQKCFVDDDTSPDFISAWRCEDRVTGLLVDCSKMFNKIKMAASEEHVQLEMMGETVL